MTLSSQEKMAILLKQIQLPEEWHEQYFQDSSLDKVVVYKKEKYWHFYITLQKVLPFTVYEAFLAYTEKAFSHIAAIKMNVNAVQNEIEATEFSGYWNLFVKQQENLIPTHQQILERGPRLEGNQLTIPVSTDAEAVSLKKRIEEMFSLFCMQAGLNHYKIVFSVETEQEKLADFRKQTSLEDQEFVRNAQKQQQERQQQKSKEEQAAEAFNIGYAIKDEPVKMETIVDEERKLTVQGFVFLSDVRQLRSGRSLLIMKATDYTDSLEIKVFSRNDEDAQKFQNLKDNMWIKARGSIQTDQFSNELTMMASDIQEINVPRKKDHAKEKRAELHAHTTMSQLDAVVSPAKLIEQAHFWGHSAIAITDHAGVQGFPEAHMAAEKYDMKVIYGVEANVVDDGVPICYHPKDLDIKEGTYVVFDVETTGLSSVFDTIIEIAGVKLYNGEVIDRFESFCNPHRPLPPKIIDITGITDDMVADAPEVDDVLKQFHEWVGDSVYV